jgi:DNA-binding SARP family transcriptional activator
MEFLVLGPLEVHHRGRLVPVRGRRQRALLARLVLNLGESVPDERLLEDLWGEAQPASGGAALRVRVSQLRKALAADSPDAAIVTRGSGYALEADREQVDAYRFERLLGEARRALREGRAAEALTALTEGLSLWRGPALADLAYEQFAQPDVARLGALRLDALEERIDAGLALGRHAELVGELEALVAAEPLRERVRAQLMLALYRSGRQADALAAYRDARRALTHDLGIEPGGPLRELERALLRHDPALQSTPAGLRPPITAPGEERKLATVLVADVGEEPDERLYEGMASLVEEAGGTVATFPGEPLAATFGAPVAQEDHAERALRVALAIRARVDDLSGGALSLRIGVETGEVVVGSPGSAAQHGATDAAACLCRAAGAGSVLVGERTAAAARHAFELGPAVQSQDAALRCRPLLRALGAPDRVGAPRSPFVGRRRELDLLFATYRRAAREERPQLATVLGDAGVGKTRLARELWESLGQEVPPPLRRAGRCVPYRGGTAYLPLAEVLREQLGLHETDSAEAVRARLGDREVLAMTLGIDAAGALSPLTAREALHSGWVSFLAEVARSRPLALLVEDLHWAHDGLLDLLERALDEVDAPLAVVATGRPELLERRPSWGRRGDAETAWLEPLPPADASAMLDSLAADLAPEIRETLLERAEGNPFFLEELLAEVVERGPDQPGGTIPDSVQAVLAARIDLLPPLEKAAVQAASVIGRSFSASPLREMLDGAEPALGVLETRDFVRPAPASASVGERELAFKHALTREVAYGSLAGEQRARLHGRFAAWLERAGGGRDEDAAELAHHYAEAAPSGTSEQAGKWLRRAGELATARYELHDAVALFQRALELEPDPQARVVLSRAVGRASALNYDEDTFLAAMDSAIAGARDRATRAELCAELAFEAFMRSGMWTRRPVTEVVTARIGEALELAAPDTRARAMALVASTYADIGDGAATASEAYAIAERLGDPTLQAVALDARQRVAMDAGEYEECWRLNRQRIGLLDHVADADVRADIVQSAIPACIATCRFDEARALARRTDELTSTLTPHHRVHGVSVLVEVEELLGGWGAIQALEERVRAAVSANERTPCTRNARSLLVCALAEAHLGEDARARELEERAAQFGLLGRHTVDAPRLRLALLRGERARAEELLAQLMAEGGWYSRGVDSSFATLVTKLDGLAALGDRVRVEELARRVGRSGAYVEPFAERALGLVRDDGDLIARAASRFDALGLDWHAAQTRALVARR